MIQWTVKGGAILRTRMRVQQTQLPHSWGMAAIKASQRVPTYRREFSSGKRMTSESSDTSGGMTFTA